MALRPLSGSSSVAVSRSAVGSGHSSSLSPPLLVEALLGARRLLDLLLLGAAIEVLFEHRVLLQLLVDQLFELGARHLQDLDRLPQLGRHHQLLAELLDEFGFQGHRCRTYRLKRSPKYNSRARRLAAIASGAPSSRITPPLRIYARSQIPSVSLTLWSVISTPMPRSRSCVMMRLDVEHRNRIDAGKRLVEQHEARRGDQGAADLDPAPLAAGQRVGVVLRQVRDARAPRAASARRSARSSWVSGRVSRIASRLSSTVSLRNTEGSCGQIADALARALVHRLARDVAHR